MFYIYITFHTVQVKLLFAEALPWQLLIFSHILIFDVSTMKNVEWRVSKDYINNQLNG